MLRQYNFDLYLNGHEHMFAYGYLRASTPLNAGSAYLHSNPPNEVCAFDIEYFFNDTTHDRNLEFMKGDALH